MRIAVWDTYVKRANGSTMHFDILVPDTIENEEAIFNFGKQYLTSKAFKTGAISARECQFCHFEEVPESIVSIIGEQGFAIIELENCN